MQLHIEISVYNNIWYTTDVSGNTVQSPELRLIYTLSKDK